MLCYVCCAVLCYVTLRYATICCVALRCVGCVALRRVQLRYVTLCLRWVINFFILRHLKVGALFLPLSLTRLGTNTRINKIFETFPCCLVCFLFIGKSQKALCHYICLCRSKLTKALKESKESLREIQRKLAHQSAVSRFKPFHSQDRNANSRCWLL